MPNLQITSHTCGCPSLLKIRKKILLWGGPHCQKGHFWAKSAPKKPFCRPSGNELTIWLQILKAMIFLYWKMALVFGFGSKIKKRHFLAKKWLFSLFSSICHLAWLFYCLKLPYLHQTSRIRCKNLISGWPSHLDWTRSKKLRKIRKQCYQTLFLGLIAFNTQTSYKLHYDQVSWHSVSKKYGFGLFFNFSWSHQNLGVFF